MRDRRQFKLPRHLIAMMAGDNPQAIKAMENIQSMALEDLPDELAVVLDAALANAMQAAMIANQLQDQLSPQLPAVPVMPTFEPCLDAVGVTINEPNYLVTV